LLLAGSVAFLKTAVKVAGGSTIGPVLTAGLGMQTDGVGNAMPAMHSIRETAGTADHLYMIRVFEE